jgi:hypothetical protein
MIATIDLTGALHGIKAGDNVPDKAPSPAIFNGVEVRNSLRVCLSFIAAPFYGMLQAI